MADKTGIAWTQATWNPVTGCNRISAGCDHCYALTMAGRLKAMGAANYQTDGDPVTSGPGFGVALHPDVLDQPMRWRRPRLIFVNSMSDVFHAKVPDRFLDGMWRVMADCPQHMFQVLTKRPLRMRRYMSEASTLPNVWVGVTVEDADSAWRINVLRSTAADVRFLSLEPLLGPLPDTDLPLDGVDWVIVGGESGPGARPMDLGWVRHIRDRCGAAGVPLFVKQLGTAAARQLQVPGKGHRLEDLPDDLQIRLWPTVANALVADDTQ